MKKDIVMYLIGDHFIRKDKSSAVRKYLLNPLSTYTNVTYKMINNKSLLKEKNKIIIFLHDPYLLKQFKDAIKENKNNNSYFWIPMWDWCYNWTDKDCVDIDKNLKIISYSKQVFKKFKELGFKNIFEIQYYHDNNNTPVNFNNGRILVYWNRRNTYNLEFLTSLCNSLNIKEFIYLEKLDWEEYDNTIPMFDMLCKFNNTNVTKFSYWKSFDEYQEYVKNCNIFLAPRIMEGIGVSMLEQFSRGAVCLGYNEATMNEYIIHKKTGYLFNTLDHEQINWEELSKLPIENMSKNVLEDAKNGYEKWKLRMDDLYNYLVE